MLIKRGERFTSSEITPRALYVRRREFIAGAGALAAGALLGWPEGSTAATVPTGAKLAATRNAAFVNADAQTPFQDAASYNNFYEFGLDKGDPSRNAHTLRTRPWAIKVEGECAKPRAFDIEELLKLAPLEERVYAFRCVEAWSMIVPWVEVMASGTMLSRASIPTVM